MIAVVGSSHVRGVEYDEGLYILRVEYKDGSVYEYEHVQPEEWDSLKYEIDSHGSIGHWLHVNIKAQKATHPFKRVK